jgi:hypothetical protein
MDKAKTKAIDADIAAMNAVYLMGLRDLATCDLREAIFRYGVSEETARIASGWTAEEIRRLAQGVFLLFRPRGARIVAQDDLASQLAQALREQPM